MRPFGIDTNVVLRMIVNDNAEQRRIALKFAVGVGHEYQGYITLVSLLEVDCALRSSYGFKRADVVLAIRYLLSVRGLQTELHSLVVLALNAMETRKVDFADALIALKSRQAGCSSIKTFDQAAAKTVPGMELLA